MKFVKKEKEETRYFVPEIAQAVGLSEGTIRGYFTNKSSSRPKKSTKDGLTLDEIEEENVQNPVEEIDNDDPEKLSRKKKSRWGNEEESQDKESPYSGFRRVQQGHQDARGIQPRHRPRVQLHQPPRCNGRNAPVCPVDRG